MARQPHSSRLVRGRKKQRQGFFGRTQPRLPGQGRALLLETLEERRLLALASPPDQPLLAGNAPLDVRLGFVNQDAHQDLVAIDAGGDLTVALNRGDDNWQSAVTSPLGLGPLHGLELGFVDGDALSDLIVQGPDAISVLRNNGAGGWTSLQTLTSPAAGSFAPADGGRVRMAFGLLDADFAFDLVAPSPGSDEIVVYRGTSAGLLGAGTRYASGGDEPVVVAVGNFIGDVLPDIAVGHRDGTVTFLEGQLAGGFVLRLGSTATGLGPVQDMAAGDFNADGELDLVVSGGDRMTLLANDPDPLPSSPIINGAFNQALTGWTTEIVGHAPGDLPGTISGLNGAAQFRENESFLVSLRQTFVVPPNPASVSFDLVSLGLADSAGGVPDAFEASLLDANNHSVVPTHRPEATSFFNANPGGVVSSATGVTYVGGKVSVDISDLAPGTPITIVFDLVGNPPGTTSVAAIDNVAISPDVIRADTFTASRLTGVFSGASGIAQGDVDGDGDNDLVVADAGENRLVIYSSDGQGGLVRSEYNTTPFGDGPTALAIGPQTAGDTIGDVAVVLDGSSLILTPLGIDQIPPEGSLISPVPDQTATGEVTSIVVEFTEAMLDAGAAGANSVTNTAAYAVYGPGPNGVFEGGAGDDGAVALASATYDAATRRVTLAIDPAASPLADGSYEIRVDGDGVTTALEDLAGNPLGGGADLTNQFVINRLGPVNLAAAPIAGNEGAAVAYAATFDNPGSAGPHSATIDWGDGTSTPVVATLVGGQWQVAAEHAYPDNGAYTIHLEVSDESLAGLVDPSVFDSTATIGNVAPTAITTTPRRIHAGIPVSLLAATFTDPGFDNLPLSSESFTATIDWGDGTPASAGEVTVTTVGSEGVLTAGDVVGTHNYAALGTFTISVTVFDDDGGSHQVSFSVTTGSKFSVVDDSSHELFRYDPEFDLLQHSDLAQHTNSPKGVDTNATGDTFWVVNSSRDISVYDRDGGFLGQWKANDATNPQGIATDGTHLWIVGIAQDKLYYYENGASRLSGETLATSSFDLDPGNRNASGLVTDGTRFWVTNEKGGDTRVFVYSMTGTLLGNWALDPANVQPSGIALDPVTGTLWVSDRHTGSVFEYAAAADLLSGALAATAEHALHADNQNPEGITDPTLTINIGDPPIIDNISVTGEVDVFEFSAATGQSVYIDFQFASAVVDWKLKSPSGTVLASGFNNVISVLDGGPVTLATAGVYRIEVTGGFGQTPSYRFQLWDVPPPDVEAMAIGDIKSGAIESPGVVDDWTFTGTAGQRIFVDFHQLNGQTLEWRLRRPSDGVVVDSGANFQANLLDKGPITLPESGTYTFRITGRGDTRPVYQFQIWDVPPVDVHPIAIGDIVDGAVESPGRSDEYQFTVIAGQEIYVDFQQASGATFTTRLLDPGGNTVYTVNAFLLSQLDRGPMVLNTPGTYTLRVGALGAATGTYRFQIWDVPDDIITTIPTNEPVFGQTNSPVETILHRFDAVAGQEYFFDVLENSQGVRFKLISPSGAILVAETTADRVIAPLAETGTYTIVASSFTQFGLITSGFGPFRFQMQEIASPALGVRDSRGTDFRIAFPVTFRDIFGGSPVQQHLFLSAEEETSGTIFSRNGAFRTSFHILAGETIRIPIPIGELAVGNISGNSIRVRSLKEISAYHLSYMPHGSDAFMAWPTDALGTEHVIAAYGLGNGLRSSQLAVVATEDDTIVTITPSISFSTFTAGVPFSVTLDAGQGYLLESGRGLTVLQTALDLTGSIVSADKPVVVYGGHTATVIPSGFVAANHLIDQLPPMDTWGRRFVTVPLATRLNGDTFRFIAGHDDTEVRVNGVLVATLDRGQFHEMMLTERSEVIGTRPLLVAQYANSTSFDGVTGDPSLMIVPPVEQFLNSYTVVAPTFGFDGNYINVVALAADVGTIELNGAPIDPALFEPIGASGYFGAQVPVAPGAHHLEAPQPFGIYSYGFDDTDAYSYPGGLNFSPVATATNLALEPATATVALGTLQAFAATVTDELGQPVVGVRVDFSVAGTNPQSGFAFTNIEGRAVFSYSGELPGNDTVTAQISNLTATASVLWSSTPPTISITSPDAGSEHRAGSFVLITGLALPGIVGTKIAGVSVNGQPVDAIDVSGQFFASVQIEEGANSFTFTATDTFGQTASETILLVGVPGSTGGFDYGNAQDFSAAGELSYERTTFNRLTEVLHADMRLTNLSDDPLRAPVLAVFERITPPAVTLAVAEGTTPEGLPWVAFDAHLGIGGLASGATSLPVPLRFANPDTARFALDVFLLAQGNLPPAFTSQPLVEAVVGIPYHYAAVAADPNNDVLAYRLTSGPANMTIDPATGAIAWTPAADQAGTFQVQIEVDDGFGGIAAQQFQVRTYAALPNRPPVIQSVPLTHVPEAADYFYQPVATDLDGHTLQYFLDAAPSGMTIDAQTGRIDWFGATVGNHPVLLRVEDGHGGRATQQYVLTVGTGVGSDVLRIDSQPPVLGVVGELYLYLPEIERSSSSPLLFTLVQSPSGMTIDASTGEIRWTPAAGQTGLSEVTMKVDDQAGGVAVQRWAIDVSALSLNQPPVFDSLPPRYATQDALFDYLPATHDPEQQALVFALDEGPAGATFDPATGRITWTPTSSQLGFHRIRLRAIDPEGASALQTFFVEVRIPNTAPQFTSPPILTTTAGEAYRDLVTATDAEDGFRFSLVAGPGGMLIDATSGLLFWRSTLTDAGDHTVTLRVTDDRGLATDRTFTLTAMGDTEAPVVSIGLSEEFVDLSSTTEIEINVTAEDNVGVTTRELTLGGVVIPFITGGRALFSPPAPGTYTFVATATDLAGNVGTTTRTLHVFDPNDTSSPVITITSPAPSATVTNLTDIMGTIVDDNLASYKVEIARRGTNQFRLLHEGPSVPAGNILATVDPTLLQNDIYVIRVTAEDVNFQVGTAEVTIHLEGGAKIGNFETDAVDLSIPVAGGPAIELVRHYDTLLADTSGACGYGWQICALEPQIRETVQVNQFETLLGMFTATPFQEGDKVYITGPDCERYGFTFAPVPTESVWAILNGTYGTIYEPRWIADPGVHMDLWGEFDRVKLNLSELTGEFDLEGLPLPLLRTEEGSYILAHLNVAYNPLGYRLINREGTMWHYSQFDGLQSVEDRNGNTLTVTANGITSSSGQAVQFQRDDAGRITKVIDPAGNEINYIYNEAGELIRAEYPNGLADEYEYEGGPEHFLSAINAAENDAMQATPTVEITYNLASRLGQIFDGLGNINTQTYDLANNTETIFDALGNPTEIEYDDRGNMIREKSPLGHEAFYQYDGDDNLTQIKDERGFITTFTYDAYGNMTSFTDPKLQTTTIEYNGLNEVIRQVDALNNEYTFVYNDRGNLIEIHGPLGVSAIFTYDSAGRPRTVTNADGHTRTMEYGDGPHPIKLIQPDGKTQELTYNHLQQIKTLTDENGHTTTFNYDSMGRVLSIVDPLGQATTMTYFGNLLASVTNKANHTTRYEYQRGRLMRVIDAQLGVTSFTYDANGHKKTETDAEGRVTTYAYYADRRLKSITDAADGVTTYEYDAYGNETAVIDANGHRTQMIYDELNFLVRREDALGRARTYTYDAVGNLRTATDPNVHTTAYEYDNLHRLAKVIDPLLGETTYTYDLRSNLLTVTDPLGRTITNTYDAYDRLLTQTDADNQVIEFGYDGVGNRTSIKNERGHTTTYTYDELDRTASMIDAAGKTWTYTYTPTDQLETSTDPLLATTQYVYDSLDRLISMTDPINGTWEYTYDKVGNQLTVEDPIDRVTTNVYDALNRLKTTTDPRNSVTQFDYDAVGNRTKVVDPSNNVTQFVYDDVNQLIQTIDPLNHSSYSEYDPAGNLIETTDRNGRVRTFAYDPLNRLTSEKWWTSGVLGREFIFTHDAVGNLLTAGDGTSAYTFTYDVLNRQKTSDNAGTVGVPHLLLTNAYDAAGNRTAVEDNTGVRVASVYDPRDLLASRTWSGGGIDPARIEFDYNDRGERTLARRFADAAGMTLIGKTSFDYDFKGRIEEIIHRNAADAILVEYDFARDLADQFTSITHHGQTSTFIHDLAGQLTSADHSALADESYDYDANGNRTIGGAVIGPNNQLQSDATHTYTYDNEGNLIRKTVIATGEYTEFDFDHRNRLVRGTTKSAGGIILEEVTYTYDVFDRKIARTVDADGAGPQAAETLYTVYDGPHAWADFDAAGNVVARYLFGDRTDEIIARFRPGEGTAWYLTDHLGTVRDIVDAAGAVINHIEYDSFGNILSQTNAVAGDRFTYTGREWDAELSLYYYRARFYDPSTGRFTSQDPLAFAAGDPNLYRYVFNSPLGATDPTGNLALTECAFVKGLNAAISVGCTVAEMWTDGSLESEDLETQVENSVRLLKSAAGILPGGSGLAFQLTLNALTAKTALEVVAPFTGPFGAVYFAVYDVFHAWKLSKENPQYFWVKAICTAADLAMMVWMAKAKCFVAGTPVVVGRLPQAALTLADGDPDRSYVLDIVGGVSLVIGIGMVVRSRRKRRVPFSNHATPDLSTPCPKRERSETVSGSEPANAACALQPLTHVIIREREKDKPCESKAPDRRTEMLSNNRNGWNGGWITVACRIVPVFVTLLVACICLGQRFGQLLQHTESRAVANTSFSSTGPRYRTVRIENVRPGDRVLADGPNGKTVGEPSEEPTPLTWRLVELRIVDSDGHQTEIQLLRPLSWIRQYSVAEGRAFKLELKEMGIDGYAGVISVKACPSIQPGEGKVVTGTFKHAVDNTAQVDLVGESPIHCTPGHLFWSDDRQDFVEAQLLISGERLRTPDGSNVCVRAVTLRRAPASVFNLEVHGEHVYYVSAAGVLVHNSNVDFDTNQELFWLFGPNPQARPTDDDGVSVWRTTNRQEVEVFMNARSGDNQANTNHGVYTRQELEAAGFSVPHTQDKAHHPVLKDKLQHHSIRPSSNADPSVKLTPAEINELDVKLKSNPPKSKHKPKIFSPCD